MSAFRQCMNTFIKMFDRSYLDLHERTGRIINDVPEGSLFRRPVGNSAAYSGGELILRSAGRVEQTFGGITTRLWDDPFEWALPEELSTRAKILAYLDDVEATRRRGFLLFESDADLSRELPAPVKMKSLFEILLETLAAAENMQGRAVGIFQGMTDESAKKRR
jgi:hypothetical protein